MTKEEKLKMPIIDFLQKNAEKYPNQTALVEINPDVKEIRRVTWKEYELIESGAAQEYKREISWSVFEEKGIIKDI